MKKVTRLVSVVLCAAMVLTLTACGAKSSNTFKIGGSGPISGSAAIYGTAVMNAAQLAIDEINEAGGVNGYKLEFNFQDDECDASKAINAYNATKDWGAKIFLGTVTSGACLAVIEDAKVDNMFLISPSASSKDCAQYSNCFRVCFSDPDQGKASAIYMNDNKLASKVAVIYDSSDAYSSGIYDSFVLEAANADFEIVSAEAFTSTSKTDFSVQIQKAKDAGAELVFLPIYYQEAALILAQSEKMGYSPIFFGCDGLDGILGVDNFDTSLAEGVMLLTPFAADAKDDLTVKFVDKYVAKYGDTPNQFAADAYDGVYAIKAAIEKSGATPDLSVSDLCEKLKTAMTEISIDGLTGTGMYWTADGEPNKAPKAVMIVNGKYVMQ